MSELTLIVGLAVILLAIVLGGLFWWQRRFWPQADNQSPTAPSRPAEGEENRLDEGGEKWQPPRSA